MNQKLDRRLFDTAVKRSYDRPLEYTPAKYLDNGQTIPKIGFDPQLKLDRYGKGALLGKLQTIATTILRLLFTEPGQFPDYPEIGIDIRKYLFSFEDEFSAALLREEILRNIPDLTDYISNPNNFKVIKTTYDDTFVVVIQLKSDIRDGNGFVNEVYMNIGITFDEFHKLTSDISFAENGNVTHFKI